MKKHIFYVIPVCLQRASVLVSNDKFTTWKRDTWLGGRGG